MPFKKWCKTVYNTVSGSKQQTAVDTAGLSAKARPSMNTGGREALVRYSVIEGMQSGLDFVMTGRTVSQLDLPPERAYSRRHATRTYVTCCNARRSRRRRGKLPGVTLNPTRLNQTERRGCSKKNLKKIS